MSDHTNTEPVYNVTDPDDDWEPSEELGNMEIDVPDEVLQEFLATLDQYTDGLREELYAKFTQADEDERNVDYKDAGWEEQQHPRGAKGGGKGGQFVKKGEGGGGGEEGGVGEMTAPTAYTGKDYHVKEHIAGEVYRINHKSSFDHFGQIRKHGQRRWIAEIRKSSDGSVRRQLGTFIGYKEAINEITSRLSGFDYRSKPEPGWSWQEGYGWKYGDVPPPVPPVIKPPDKPPPPPPPTPPYKKPGAVKPNQQWADNVPKPPSYRGAGTIEYRIMAVAQQGLRDGVRPEVMADQIKEIAGRYVHSVTSKYSNQVLRHIEQANAMEEGSLGYAKPKAKEKPGGGGTPPPTPPPPKPAPPPPTPPISGLTPEQQKEKQRDVISQYLQQREQIKANVDNRYGNQRKALRSAFNKARVELMQTGMSERDARLMVQTAIQEGKPPPVVSGKPQSFSEVINYRKAHGGEWSLGERKRHDGAWDYASPQLFAAMAQTRSLRNVSMTTTEVSFYRHDHSIHMRPAADQVVWRHEYGHAIDIQGVNYRSARAEQDRVEEADALIKKVQAQRGSVIDYPDEPRAYTRQVAQEFNLTEDDIAKFTTHNPGLMGFSTGAGTRLALLLKGEHVGNVTRMVRTGATVSESLMFGDFLGSMTKNVVGSGHSDDYYAKEKAKACAEMFANYVCLTNGRGGAVYRAILHSVAPKCCKHFDDILRETAEGKLWT